MENETVVLEDLGVCCVRLPFGVACCVCALSELRLFAREVIEAEHWFVDGKVPFCVKTFISSSQ